MWKEDYYSTSRDEDVRYSFPHCRTTCLVKSLINIHLHIFPFPSILPSPNHVRGAACHKDVQRSCRGSRCKASQGSWQEARTSFQDGTGRQSRLTPNAHKPQQRFRGYASQKPETLNADQRAGLASLPALEGTVKELEELSKQIEVGSF